MSDKEDVCNTLYETAAVLRSLDSLIQQGGGTADYSAGELIGLGFLLQTLSQKIFESEGALRELGN